MYLWGFNRWCHGLRHGFGQDGTWGPGCQQGDGLAKELRDTFKERLGTCCRVLTKRWSWDHLSIWSNYIAFTGG